MGTPLDYPIEGICMQVLVWHPLHPACTWLPAKLLTMGYVVAYGYGKDDEQFCPVRWAV